MPNDLISHDPLISQNFFLEIDGEVVSVLSSVSGLDIEVEVASIQQAGKTGKSQMVRTLGNQNKAPELQLARMAPVDSTSDKMWTWFNEIRDKGMVVGERAKSRKNGSIVIYDTSNAEACRFNFYNAWPSKIATDQLSIDSQDPVKESITLQCERLERVK
ncbi:MAG TPA: phage tail protein [Frankiaceae bacterium]|nr:phage tail protein [Frankiaceae bacterium]